MAKRIEPPPPDPGEKRPSGSGEAPVQDVSAAGIGLLLPEQFKPGTLLAIDLPGSEASAVTVLACVVRAAPQAGGMWDVGCQFTLELDDQDLLRFGSGPAKGRPFDRRAQARRSYQVRVAYRPAQSGRPKRLSAPAIHATVAGAVFVSRRPVEVGTLLDWSLPGALTILATVARVAAEGDRWVCVCPFIRELSAQELKAVRANLRVDG
jgi:hypothetical protein